MPSEDPDRTELGLTVARELTLASEQAWPVILTRLRSQRQLSAAVRQMNVLLSDPAHADLARAALRRIGLEHGG